MTKNPIEDWLQTFAAGVVAATLPPVAGWTVRLVDSRAPWVVLVLSPCVVFLFARWAARVTRGSPVIRASIVGLTPGAVLVWALVERHPAALLAGAAPFTPWALLTWTLLNLACGVRAGATVRRRPDRNAA